MHARLRDLGLDRGTLQPVPGDEQVPHLHEIGVRPDGQKDMLNAWIMRNVRGDYTNAARQQDA